MALLTKERAIEDGISIGQIEAVAYWNIEMAKTAAAERNGRSQRDSIRLMDQGKHLERLAQELRDDG